MNEVIFAVVGLAVLTVVVEAISRFVGKSVFGALWYRWWRKKHAFRVLCETNLERAPLGESKHVIQAFRIPLQAGEHTVY